MSGFERSAPIPGSQGPRRSQLVRHNNAPPPMTPWRMEVLEAQREAAKAVAAASGRGGKSRSRSRSRSKSPRRKPQPKEPKEHKEASHGTGGHPAASSTARQNNVPLPGKQALLRQYKERGEGFYSAIARAAEAWDTIKGPGKKDKNSAGNVKGASGEDGSVAFASGAAHDRGLERRQKRAKEEEQERRERLERDMREETDRRTEQKKEQERLEKQWAEETIAKEQRQVEERKRAEEERTAREQQQKQRKAKLKGAFAFGGDDDDEEEARRKKEVELVRKAADRRKQEVKSAVLSVPPPSQSSQAAAVQSSAQQQIVEGEDLSTTLRFEGGLDVADAFMRLQERKRKGRRTEFGGPPRNCSPWRDGKKGVSFDERRPS